MFSVLHLPATVNSVFVQHTWRINRILILICNRLNCVKLKLKQLDSQNLPSLAGFPLYIQYKLVPLVYNIPCRAKKLLAIYTCARCTEVHSCESGKSAFIVLPKNKWLSAPWDKLLIVFWCYLAHALHIATFLSFSNTQIELPRPLMGKEFQLIVEKCSSRRFCIIWSALQIGLYRVHESIYFQSTRVTLDSNQ